MQPYKKAQVQEFLITIDINVMFMMHTFLYLY